MPPHQGAVAESTIGIPPTSPGDERSYYHVVIASCDTREAYPNYCSHFMTFVEALENQERHPTHVVLLTTEKGPKCDDMVTITKQKLSVKGIMVYSCPMEDDGDLGAFGRAISMLQDDFRKNMGSSFDTAWVTYLSFPATLHKSYCRNVFKTLMLSRWCQGDSTQLLLFDEKYHEKNDTFAFCHEMIVSGLCATLFVSSKLFRILCQQGNVYWPGVFMIFCRSPVCLDDGIGVTRFANWPDPQNPIISPMPGEKVNFDKKIGEVVRCLGKKTNSNITEYLIKLDASGKEIALQEEEFEMCPRSMRDLEIEKRMERMFSFRAKVPDFYMDRDLAYGVIDTIETAVEAAMTVGALEDQQLAVMDLLREHVRKVAPKERSEFEKSLILALLTTHDEETVLNDLGFPKEKSLKEALATEERTDSELTFTLSRAPVIGPINLCRMLGIEPTLQENLLDDKKEVGGIGGTKLLGTLKALKNTPITPEEIAQSVFEKFGIPQRYHIAIEKYAKIYCLSKGCLTSKN